MDFPIRGSHSCDTAPLLPTVPSRAIVRDSLPAGETFELDRRQPNDARAAPRQAGPSLASRMLDPGRSVMNTAAALAEHSMPSGSFLKSAVATAVGATSGFLAGEAIVKGIEQAPVFGVALLTVAAGGTGFLAGALVGDAAGSDRRPIPLGVGVAGAFVAGAVGAVMCNAGSSGLGLTGNEIGALGGIAAAGGLAAVAGVVPAPPQRNTTVSPA